MFGTTFLDSSSVSQDPLVAVQIYDAGPTGVNDLVKTFKDKKIKVHSKALEELEPYNLDIYNKRVLGTFAYETVAELMLTDGLNKEVKIYKGYRINHHILADY